jgi:hypothetical protein
MERDRHRETAKYPAMSVSIYSKRDWYYTVIILSIQNSIASIKIRLDKSLIPNYAFPDITECTYF